MRNEGKKYLVIDLDNSKYLLATNKNMIADNTGIHRNSLLDLTERKTIKGYYILTLKRGIWN